VTLLHTILLLLLDFLSVEPLLVMKVNEMSVSAEIDPREITLRLSIIGFDCGGLE
jgi:hypothetical protein